MSASSVTSPVSIARLQGVRKFSLRTRRRRPWRQCPQQVRAHEPPARDRRQPPRNPAPAGRDRVRLRGCCHREAPYALLSRIRFWSDVGDRRCRDQRSSAQRRSSRPEPELRPGQRVEGLELNGRFRTVVELSRPPARRTRATCRNCRLDRPIERQRSGPTIATGQDCQRVAAARRRAHARNERAILRRQTVRRRPRQRAAKHERPDSRRPPRTSDAPAATPQRAVDLLCSAVSGHRGRYPSMESPALARKGLLVDRFLDQRVPEPIAARSVIGLEKAYMDSLAQAPLEGAVVQVGHGADEIVAGGPADHGCDPDDRLGVFAHLRGLRRGRLGHRRRQVCIGIRSGQQFFDEESVSLGALVDLPEQRVGRRASKDRGELVVDFGTSERRQRQKPDARSAAQLSQR